jgi:hypothetical protein
MTEKKRQQLLIGLGIWKLELKSELGRRAKERKLVFGGCARPGRLSGILSRLKKESVNENHYRGKMWQHDHQDLPAQGPPL